MNVVKDVGKVVIAAVMVVTISIVMIYLTVGIGYLLGMLIATLPIVSGSLTATLPITSAQIPGIVAWITVVGMFIGTGRIVLGTIVNTFGGE